MRSLRKKLTGRDQRLYEFRSVVLSTELCRLGERHNLCPLLYRLSAGKTLPANTSDILSIRNCSILMMSSSLYLLYAPEWSITKYVSSRHKTKYVYIRFPFLWMKQFRMIAASLFWSFWCRTDKGLVEHLDEPATPTFLCEACYAFYKIQLLLVIRFMADLLRKYRWSVMIMVGRGGAEPHYVHNWPPIFSW